MKVAMDEEISQPTAGETPSPNAIGSEFARQYYTLLADNPAGVHRFYGHDSHLLLDNVVVTGQQKIGEAIEEAFKEHCRIRIVSIKGLNTANKGIALHVFGELRGARFVQTFILCPQGAKKYFVHSSLFQHIDQVFQVGDEIPEKQQMNNVGSPIRVNGQVTSDDSPGETPVLAASPPPSFVEDVPVPAPVVSPEVVMQPVVTNPIEANVNGGGEIKREITPRKDDLKENKKEAKERITPLQPPMDESPKTWAKMVGGSSGKASVTPASVPPSRTVKAPFKPQQPNGVGQVHTGSASASRQGATTRPQPSTQTNKDKDCRVYLGGITMNSTPDHDAAVNDIKVALSKFGDVESVSVPRKVFEGADSTKTAFAFITMRDISGVQNMFEESKKEESGKGALNLKLPAFGFEGEVTISEARAPNPRGPSFVRRGGQNRGGRGGRGGFRGGHSAHNNH